MKRREVWKKSLSQHLREAGKNPHVKHSKRVKKHSENQWRLEVYQALDKGKPLPLEVYDTLNTEEKRILFFQSYKEVSQKWALNATTVEKKTEYYTPSPREASA